MLIGFFCAALCALPAGQLSIGPGSDRGASLVQRNGTVVGRYIDDTYPGDPRALAAQFQAEHVGMILVGSYDRPESFGPGTTNVVEHYPVLDQRSVVTPPPAVPPGAGYVLQSFSWGDNLTDGIDRGRCSPADSPAVCAARYAAPTVSQMQTSWCQARRTDASIVLWFYYSAATAPAILAMENAACPDSAIASAPAPDKTLGPTASGGHGDGQLAEHRHREHGASHAQRRLRGRSRTRKTNHQRLQPRHISMRR